jgi:hypothetical protein
VTPLFGLDSDPVSGSASDQAEQFCERARVTSRIRELSFCH